ncbi:hypothetical protein ACOSQ4_017082 [Xanthoceras sorbifolium]
MDTREVERLCEALSLAEPNKKVAVLDGELFLKVNMGNPGKDVIMLLRYERLLEYCFRYGFIGHSMRECEHGSGVGDTGLEDSSFGSWMRAWSPVKSRVVRPAIHSLAVASSTDSGLRGEKASSHGRRWKRRARDKIEVDMGMAHKELGTKRSIPWLCGGNFNEILEDSEKKGGNPRPRFLIKNFRFALDSCGLSDLGFSGPPFTWFNKRDGNHAIMERLDRFVGSWSYRGCRRFFFEDCWADLEECAHIVTRCWNVSLGEQWRAKDLMACLAHCASALGTWNGDNLWHDLLLHDEVYWKQRSRVAWLKDGDRNTRFFHSQASKRKKKNAIQGLLDSFGVWKDQPANIVRVIVSYFLEIFTSSNPSTEDILAVSSSVGQRLSAASRHLLDRPFSVEEVRIVLFDMAHSKVLGLDGFNAGFYQKFWPAIGKSVMEMYLGILNDHHPMRELNHTLIVLILKIERTSKMGDFHPISLCNVSLKIVTKTLANRLSGVLGDLISETQSAFIPGRAIFDNAIVGFECMHALKRKRKGKTGYYAASAILTASCSSSGSLLSWWRILCLWSSPPAGSFKLNVDASVAVSAGIVGLGLAIRDDLGRMRAAGSIGITASLDPSLAKAMAVLHGIRLAIDSGFSPILVESDALGVINVLRDGVIPSSYLGLIVLDIFSFVFVLLLLCNLFACILVLYLYDCMSSCLINSFQLYGNICARVSSSLFLSA